MAELSRWPVAEVETRSEAIRHVNQHFAPVNVRGRGHGEGDRGYYKLQGLTNDQFTVGYISSNLEFDAEVLVEPSSYLLGFTTTGSISVVSAEQQVLMTRANATILNPGERLHLRTTADPLGLILLRLGRRAVNEELALLLGSRPRSDVRFDFSIDLSAGRGLALNEVLRSSVRRLNSRHDLFATAAMQQGEIRSFTRGLLLTQPHTYSATLRGGAGTSSPGSLSRAMEYIDSHFDEPIALSDLARAAGRSPRTVEATFHAHLGISPLTYLRNVRLDHARSLLLRSDDRAGDIAINVGFAHLGRFAAAYRKRFGESPSETRLMG